MGLETVGGTGAVTARAVLPTDSMNFVAQVLLGQEQDAGGCLNASMRPLSAASEKKRRVGLGSHRKAVAGGREC